MSYCIHQYYMRLLAPATRPWTWQCEMQDLLPAHAPTRLLLLLLRGVCTKQQMRILDTNDDSMTLRA